MTPPPGAPAFLIVDGHSVIFAWDDLREMHFKNQSRAREELCRRLRLLHDTGEERVVIVFDGKGPRASSSRENADDIQIIYSDSKRTADSVIERLTARYAAEYKITVATADRAEQMTVATFGGFFINPDELLKRLRDSEDNLARRLNRMRHR